MPMTSKEMIKFLKKNGFEVIRTSKGSHYQLKNPTTNRRTTVPYHSGTLGKGLENEILKQAGLKK